MPHARKARDLLLTGGFEQSPEARMTVADIATEVEIDILSGGKRPTEMEILPLPMPREVSAEPRILPLEMLITHKLSAGRAQDFADVVALTKANVLPRDYPVDLAVRTDYEEAWDTAAAEEAVRGMMQEDDEEP